MQDIGLQVHLLCNEPECGTGLVEAVDAFQDWQTFLKSLFGDFSGKFISHKHRRCFWPDRCKKVAFTEALQVKQSQANVT